MRTNRRKIEWSSIKETKIIKRAKEIMEKDGLYVTLFICFCIVSVAAVWTVKDNLNEYKNKSYIEYNEAENQKVMEEDVRTVDAKNNVMPQDILIEEDSRANNDITDEASEEVNTSGQKPAVVADKPVFDKPVRGEIFREYAGDSLIFSATLDRYVTHNGIDIESEMDAPVCAVLNGKVLDIKEDDAMGITICLEHENNLMTVYSNLSTKEMVKVGDEINKGDIISGVGDTALMETLDKPHLHFEVINKGQYEDPMKYFRIN